MSWNRREFLGRSLMGVACLPLASAAVPASASPARPGNTAASDMERWLLDTGRSHIEAPVYDLAASRIR
ncbi:MAG TPA: twin-arginine translocation signal domain-containing protein [Thermoanaerobaculia bacterium]|nr:twin-arginine translocation signal domain-containing protein [Thermoanaerobaculia bacterium]